MANEATDYLEVQIRMHLFRTGTFAKPTILACGLFTAAPGETGGGTEVSGGSYARVSNNPADANWTAASATDGLTDNAGALTFPAPTANWGVVTHTAWLDATGGGNMWVYAALAVPKTVNNGDAAPSFAAGAFDITIG
jgi:hypothetical protein